MISISDARVMCVANNLRQVIIFGWDGAQTHAVTYGVSAADSQQAAAGANVIKRGWDWPEDLCTDTTRIQDLEARIAELELELQKLKSESRADDTRHFVRFVAWGETPTNAMPGDLIFTHDPQVRYDYIWDIDKSCWSRWVPELHTKE